MTINCPICRVILNIPDQYAGTEGKCNHCNNNILVPEINKFRNIYREPLINTYNKDNNSGEVNKGCIGCSYIVALFIPILGLILGLWLVFSNKQQEGRTVMLISFLNLVLAFILNLIIISANT